MKSCKKTASLAVIFVLTIGTVTACAARLDDIEKRGTLRVGTTGDYRPMSYLNKETGKYEGHDAELAELIAGTLGVKVEYVPTTWKTLSKDTADDKFDVAICGITRTFLRDRQLDMSDGYLLFGKTILCRKADNDKFKSLADLNKQDVRVMVNPGGTNEKFARANLPNCTLIVHEQNAEIPGLVADGQADIMITETMEAKRYAKLDERLGDPLVNDPFTKNRFGILMPNDEQDFLNYINFVLDEFNMDGTMKKLEEKYID